MTARRLVLALLLVLAACQATGSGSSTTTPAPTGSPAASATSSAPQPTTTAPRGPVPVRVTEVARGLQVVWALAFDPSGRLWFTERPGRLTRQGDQPRTIVGVATGGEAGLMGLEIDKQGRMFLMYTSLQDNKIVRLEPDGSQKVLVEGLAKNTNHDGGRIRFGPDGMLYAGTGDAQNGPLAQDDSSRNGKILQINPDTGETKVFSKGRRNPQGLCFAPDGRFLSTEHGPERGDEINVITQGSNGGWPGVTGNGIHNYTPTIAPAGCVVYSADLIPQWKGSLLFTTLKDESLRRLSFNPDGSVAAEEVLYQGEYGRLRDVAVAPDGSVYLATSNRDGRGSPTPADDRILRIAPG